MTTRRTAPLRITRPTALYVGLALSVVATLAPLIDVATVDLIGAHVREAYPDWPPDSVAADRTAIAAYLGGTGAAGILLWLLSIRGVTGGRRWARPLVTVAFVVGLVMALANLGVGGEGYDVVVPYAYGALTLLPCIAGIAAVASVWRRDRPAT